jgi:undecaprenyl-diphosphatase
VELIEILKVFLYGLVEGITEWLPVSSTGHLIILEQFVPLKATDEFMEMFDVVIQLGAILAVVVLYFRKLNPWAKGKRAKETRETIELWIKVIIACLPAAVIGILFDDKIDEMFYNCPTIAVTLILYGILFLVVERKRRDADITELKELPYSIAFGIGVAQLLALIPGTSRSGVTIIAALLMGTSRFVAAEFTFFLAIPVMFGASLLKILKFAKNSLEAGTGITNYELLTMGVGMVSAFLVSILAIKFLMGYIKKNDFKVFGVYRILLGIVLIVLFACGVLVV